MVSSSWVGPTECDDARTRRTRTAGNIWRALKPDVYLHLDFGNAVDFLREAQSCYQNGAYMATALMCRSSTETAVYLSLARKRKGLQIAVNLDSIRDTWLGILSKARQSSILDYNTEKMLEHIRKKGNFAAHYGQKFDEKIAQGQGLGRLWITRVEAEELLRQTVRVLDHLRRAVSPEEQKV